MVDTKRYLTRGIESVLNNLPIDDGKLRFVTDTGRLFLDNSNERIEITDFVKGLKEEEIKEILAPLPKLYLSSDTKRIFVHDGDDWICCAERNFDTDEELSTTSTNPIQNKVVNAAIEDTKTYTDQKIADLINDAPETLDTLKEIADTIEEHQDMVDTLNSAIGNKVNKDGSNATGTWSINIDGTATNAVSSEKAIQDDSGNVITDTYATKKELEEFDSVVELTRAEYDALPDSKYSDGITYFIKDQTPSNRKALVISYDNTNSSLESTNVQDAIDELSKNGGGGGGSSVSIDIDDALDATSTNPVQNKVVTETINDIMDNYVNKSSILSTVAECQASTNSTDVVSAAALAELNTVESVTINISDTISGATGSFTAYKCGKVCTVTWTNIGSINYTAWTSGYALGILPEGFRPQKEVSKDPICGGAYAVIPGKLTFYKGGGIGVVSSSNVTDIMNGNITYITL